VPEPAVFIDELSARGAHRLLTELMVPFHFLHEQALLQRLDEFKVVILPDQRHLPDSLARALQPWVKAGGVLIATALSGTLDEEYHETGRFALEELFGVRLEAAYDQSHAYIDVTDPRLKAGALDMPHLVEAPSAFVRPLAGDVQVLARLLKIYLRSDGQFLLRWSPVGQDSGCPAITLRQVGRGWACYIASNIFRAYQAKNQWNLKPILANLLSLTLPEPLVKVDTPAWVEVTLMRQPAAHSPSGCARLLVHLVNHHGDRPLDGNYRCSEQVLPVSGVQVHVRQAQRPARVSLEPAGTVPAWSYGDGVLTVQVPEVAIHQVVAIE
jgi:hypothetical protein